MREFPSSSSNDLSIAGVLKSSSLIFIQFIILNLTGLIYFSLATRFLSKFDMGLLLMASVLINGFTTFFSLAFNYTAAKFCADFSQSNNGLRAKAITKIVLIVASICFIASLTLGYLFTYLVFSPFFNNHLFILLVTIDGSINTLMFFFYGILLGFFRYGKAVLAFSLASALRFSFSSIVIILGGSFLEVIITWIIGDLIALMFFLLFSYDLIDFKIPISKNYYKDLLKFSTPLYISTILSYVFLYVDRYQVLYNSNLSNFATYGAAITASLILMNLPQLISNALLPYYSSSLSISKYNFISLFNSTTRVICAVLIPLVIALAMSAEPIIYIFAGEKYLEAWPIFFIVTLAIGATFPIATFTSALLALNKSKIVMYGNLVAISIGVMFTQILYNVLNLEGAALGRALLFLLYFIFIFLWLEIKEKIHYDFVFHYKSVIISLIVFSPMLLINLYKVLTNLYLIISLSIILFSIYLFFITRIKLINEKDLENLLLIFPSPFNKYFYNLFVGLANFKTSKRKFSAPPVIYQPNVPNVYTYIYIKPHMQ